MQLYFFNVFPGMGLLLILFIKLSCIKYGDVKNLQKIEYLYDF